MDQRSNLFMFLEEPLGTDVFGREWARMEVGTGVQFTGEIRSCVTTSNLSARTVKMMRMLLGFPRGAPTVW